MKTYAHFQPLEKTPIPLSPKAEKRYLKMEEDFKRGRNVYQAKNLGELMNQLEK